jgi:ABC-type transport system involved in multi-copper enzyme maturation permease subunit
MNLQLQAISAEFLKLRHLRITWITFAAFSLAPVMGAVFMVILTHPEMNHSPALTAKANLMSFTASWTSYIGMLAQAVGVGGVLIFAFVSSWIFGREFSDKTVKDILALPVSRVAILNAKYICYLLWCLALSVSNLAIGFAIGLAMGLPPVSFDLLVESLRIYFTTALLTIPLGTVVTFFALYGKGYLAPLGLITLTIVIAQIIAAVGFGHYFPWALPGLYSGTSGEMQSQLNEMSYAIWAFTCVTGYAASVLWWKYADNK